MSGIESGSGTQLDVREVHHKRGEGRHTKSRNGRLVRCRGYRFVCVEVQSFKHDGFRELEGSVRDDSLKSLPRVSLYSPSPYPSFSLGVLRLRPLEQPYRRS